MFLSAVCPCTGDEAGAPGAPGGPVRRRLVVVIKASVMNKWLRLLHRLIKLSITETQPSVGGGAPTNAWFGHVSGMCFSFFFFFNVAFGG